MRKYEPGLSAEQMEPTVKTFLAGSLVAVLLAVGAAFLYRFTNLDSARWVSGSLPSVHLDRDDGPPADRVDRPTPAGGSERSGTASR